MIHNQILHYLVKILNEEEKIVNNIISIYPFHQLFNDYFQNVICIILIHSSGDHFVKIDKMNKHQVRKFRN